jgi:ribosomal protein S12 methylthiotransferase accessory factor
VIPERPRLHPRSLTVETSSGVLVRRTRRGSLFVASESASSARASGEGSGPSLSDREGAAFRRLVHALDGRAASAVLAALAPDELLLGLGILGALDARDLLIADGAEPLPPRLPLLPHPRASAGSAARRVEIVCIDAPDFELLRRAHRAAEARGGAYLPAFGAGEELVVGPVVEPGVTACARCLELRWLGIAPAVEVERAYLRLLATGGAGAAPMPAEAIGWMREAASHRAAAWMDGEDTGGEAWIADMTTGERSAHAVLRHPRCDLCRDKVDDRLSAPRPLARGRGAPPLAALGARIAQLVDARFGVVSPAELHVVPEGAGFATASARFAVPEPEAVRGRNDNATFGIARAPEAARIIAQIEGIERYASALDVEPAVVAAHREVAADAVCPLDLPLYAPHQYQAPGFPFAPHDEARAIGWTWGHDLRSGRPRLVPSDAVACGGSRDRLLEETSSGVAAHGAWAEAVLAALLELVERDAFMIFWLHRLSPPRIVVGAGACEWIGDALAAIERGGYRPVLLDITTDLGIPVVLALGARTDGLAPALLLGAGAGLDRTRAARKALGEAVGAVLSNGDRVSRAARLYRDDEVLKLADHAAAYAHPAWLERTAFLWASARTVPLRDPASPEEKGDGTLEDPAGERAASRLARAVGALSAAGHEVIAVDRTPPEVAGAGVFVGRVIAPGLQPIGFGRHGVRLGGRRLYEAPARMGYTSAERLNPDPHCFP